MNNLEDIIEDYIECRKACFYSAFCEEIRSDENE